MTVAIERPTKTLSDFILDSQSSPAEPHEFWLVGDSSETNFSIPSGWKPKHVYVDGSLMKPGSGDDYTVSFDGFAYTVVFAVAPAAVNIGIIGFRSKS